MAFEKLFKSTSCGFPTESTKSGGPETKWPGENFGPYWVRRSAEVCSRHVRLLGSVACSKPAENVTREGTGGEGGIRTPDTVTRMPHFECGAFNHSATSPRELSGYRHGKRVSRQGPGDRQGRRGDGHAKRPDSLTVRSGMAINPARRGRPMALALGPRHLLRLTDAPQPKPKPD